MSYSVRLERDCISKQCRNNNQMKINMITVNDFNWLNQRNQRIRRVVRNREIVMVDANVDNIFVNINNK